MRSYKIKRDDGKFSSGGSYPNWTDGGKLYPAISYIKGMLSTIPRQYIKKFDDCEVVEYDLVEVKRYKIQDGKVVE